MKKLLLLLSFLMISSLVMAHGEEEHAKINDSHFPVHSFVEKYSIINLLTIGFVLIVILLLFSHLNMQKLSDKQKIYLFYTIIVATLIPTAYLVVSTILLNIESETGGPVHWHADYEVWYCGEKLLLQESNDLSGRIGSPTIHHHNDYRMHIEGTLKRNLDASLSNYFKTIGGVFETGRMQVILQDETIFSFKNGEKCSDGKEAHIEVFVNGEKIENYLSYVLAPHENVPPGDFIEIVFDSNPVSKFKGLG